MEQTAYRAALVPLGELKAPYWVRNNDLVINNAGVTLIGRSADRGLSNGIYSGACTERSGTLRLQPRLEYTNFQVVIGFRL